MPRVTLGQLVQRSTSGKQRKPRKLSAYQKADSAIWAEHRAANAQLDSDYFSGRISKRKYESQKKLVGATAMSKRSANIAKNNRDSEGNPKRRTWGSPAQRAALQKAQKASAAKRKRR